MANVNAMIATQSLATKEILSTVGNFPYLQVAQACPHTTNVADVIDIQIGDLLKIDKTSGKLAKYVSGDTEDVRAVAADNYNGQTLHDALMKPGTVDSYICGHIRVSECFMTNGVGARVKLTDLEVQKARKNGIFLL